MDGPEQALFARGEPFIYSNPCSGVAPLVVDEPRLFMASQLLVFLSGLLVAGVSAALWLSQE